MAIMLPGWVVDILNFLQFEWPKANEDVLNQWADQWKGLDATLDGYSADIQAALATVNANNSGAATNAMVAWSTSESANVHHAKDAGTVAYEIGVAHGLAAGAVLIMKGAVVTQLGLIGIGAAMSAGVAVFLFKEVIKRALDWVIGECVSQLLAG